MTGVGVDEEHLRTIVSGHFDDVMWHAVDVLVRARGHRSAVFKVSNAHTRALRHQSQRDGHPRYAARNAEREGRCPSVASGSPSPRSATRFGCCGICSTTRCSCGSGTPCNRPPEPRLSSCRCARGSSRSSRQFAHPLRSSRQPIQLKRGAIVLVWHERFDLDPALV